MYEKLTENMEFLKVINLVSFRGDNVVDEKFTGLSLKFPTGISNIFISGPPVSHNPVQNTAKLRKNNFTNNDDAKLTLDLFSVLNSCEICPG